MSAANANLLKFSPMKHNAKLVKLGGKGGWTFSLLSGWTCPYAKNCLSRVVIGDDGKRHVEDGKHTEYRCFSASEEALYTPVYNQRKHNTTMLRACKSTKEMVELIQRSLPRGVRLVRIHVGGDYFNQLYFDAWVEVARINPKVRFYSYTKSTPFWMARLNDLPENFILTASYGGFKDNLIDKYSLRYAKVVMEEDEAKLADLSIDNDDSHAAENGPSFALLIHGSQPKGSKAGKAVKALKGLGSYGRAKKK